jgi:hypothetical protein
MDLRIVTAALIGAALLGGCMPSPQEQAAAAARQRADDQSRCTGFGFTPGTDAFAQCMMTTANQRDAQAAADLRAAKARKDAAYQACLARIAAQHPPNPSDDPLRQKIILESQAVGNC